MKLPAWIRPPTSTTGELEQQLRAAEDSHRDALGAVARAQRAFDDDPTPGAERDLLSARETERRAAEHVGRAQRLLDAARERDAQAEREKLKARKAELERSLSTAGLIADRAPALQAEIDALIAAAEAHAQRIAVEREIAARQSELLRVRERLGENVVYPSGFADISPNLRDLKIALDAKAKQFGHNDDRSRYLNDWIHAYGGIRNL